MTRDNAFPSESRTAEVSNILNSVQDLILPYIYAADEAKRRDSTDEGGCARPVGGRTTLVDPNPPEVLPALLHPKLPIDGRGVSGLLQAAQSILEHSVNTWDPGFLDKLYGATDAPGVAAELLLAVLNTNVHVYTVSPALTTIEKYTARALANLFGLRGSNAGGVAVPGGTASNLTSLLVARNYMFPQAKTEGMASIGAPLIVFTSTESHYSISTSAAQLGLGSRHVRAIPTTANGSMNVKLLREAVESVIDTGDKPFYVCGTAGTTVNGAYDPLEEIAEICKEYGLWFHIDGSWGGPAIFSTTYRHLLAGSQFADSISVSSHKMLGVPLTCSFLLGADMRQLYFANNLEAGYLFHGMEPKVAPKEPENGANGGADQLKDIPAWDDVFDLAKFTPQCGRKGDSLKMYLAWQYYGVEGFAKNVDAAFGAARQLAAILSHDERVVLLNGKPPPCCQVCFRYVGRHTTSDKERNSKITRGIVAALVRRGWMIDFTTSPEGEYMRVVCNRNTNEEIVRYLADAIVESGEEVLDSL